MRQPAVEAAVSVLANTMRIYVEAQMRFMALFKVDREEAINNVDRAFEAKLEAADWVRDLGAHHVINHSEPLAPQIAALGLGAPGFVFSTNQTAHHLAAIADVIAPQGRFGTIDLAENFNPGPFFQEAVSLHFELMFTRSLFQTPDMAEQGRLLSEVADLVDTGKIRTTRSEVMGKIDAATLLEAHRLIETGAARGKMVLEGF